MLRLNSAAFFSIPTMLVSYDCGIKFDIYIRKGRMFFLFARHGELTDFHKQRLREHNVETLYVHAEDIASYDEYIELNFSGLLQDDNVPLNDRSKMLYDYSIGLVKILMECEEKILPTHEHREKLEFLTSNTFEYLARKKGAAKSIAGMLSHSHRTYNHCVNVSIYVMLVLVSLGYEKQKAKLIGTGSALHDIGKTKVPKDILDKPGRLTDEERLIINQHPADGLELCRNMRLDDISKDCIIHHHEKLDGSGYPAQQRIIPEHVRIVTVADIYDALTSDRPYARPYNSFRALKIIIQDAEAGRLDKDICREFVKILSEGQLIPG